VVVVPPSTGFGLGARRLPVPAGRHRTGGARLWSMCELKRLRSAQVIGSGHALSGTSAATTTNLPPTPIPTAGSRSPAPSSIGPS